MGEVAGRPRPPRYRHPAIAGTRPKGSGRADVEGPFPQCHQHAQVPHCKTVHFLKRFGTDALPKGPELAAMMGKFQFLTEGYDDDPQEINAIPEIRKFYQQFHRA